MPPTDELEGLRALHLPPSTASVWADVGFAVALGLLLALLVALAIRLLARPRVSLRATTLEAFDTSLRLPPGERRAAQAALLRRVVRSVDGEAAARSSGPQWGAALDRTFRTDLFGGREGRVFTEVLYARAANDDNPGLDRELGVLIAKLER